MKLTPLKNKIVVIPDPIVEKKVGNLIIPIGALTNKNIYATVTAVGPGVRNRKTGVVTPPDIEPGDRVLLHKYAGSRVYIDRQEIMLIDIDEILGVETT
jgi:chaperonin GroES